MAPSAVDRARAQWGIDQGSAIVINGTGDGLGFDDARRTARGLMPQLVGFDGVVRETTLAGLDALLTSFGLKYLVTESREFNPPGRMLFYQRGMLLVRIKTKGNPPDAKHRVDQPHLSVGLMKDDQDTGFESEIVKFSPTGRAQPKSINAKPDERSLMPVRGTLKKPKYDGDKGQWASSTHFNFPPEVTFLA